MEDSTNQTNNGSDEEGLTLAMKDELYDSRRRMSWVALWSMVIPTAYIILRVSNVQQLEQLADLMSWYYLALASIVGAYFGFKAWATIRGRDKS